MAIVFRNEKSTRGMVLACSSAAAPQVGASWWKPIYRLVVRRPGSSSAPYDNIYILENKSVHGLRLSKSRASYVSAQQRRKIASQRCPNYLRLSLDDRYMLVSSYPHVSAPLRQMTSRRSSYLLQPNSKPASLINGPPRHWLK
ncbi:hypothetical protein GQ53DRAFT_446292 [Thozetella sp. PMI_491]|nr:hypothetical protein GQ53DRAFT_446292 [Thozetella sp. PMI_491]